MTSVKHLEIQSSFRDSVCKKLVKKNTFKTRGDARKLLTGFGFSILNGRNIRLRIGQRACSVNLVSILSMIGCRTLKKLPTKYTTSFKGSL